MLLAIYFSEEKFRWPKSNYEIKTKIRIRGVFKCSITSCNSLTLPECYCIEDTLDNENGIVAERHITQLYDFLNPFARVKSEQFQFQFLIQFDRRLYDGWFLDQIHCLLL